MSFQSNVYDRCAKRQQPPFSITFFTDQDLPILTYHVSTSTQPSDVHNLCVNASKFSISINELPQHSEEENGEDYVCIDQPVVDPVNMVDIESSNHQTTDCRKLEHIDDCKRISKTIACKHANVNLCKLSMHVSYKCNRKVNCTIDFIDAGNQSGGEGEKEQFDGVTIPVTARAHMGCRRSRNRRRRRCFSASPSPISRSSSALSSSSSSSSTTPTVSTDSYTAKSSENENDGSSDSCYATMNINFQRKRKIKTIVPSATTSTTSTSTPIAISSKNKSKRIKFTDDFDASSHANINYSDTDVYNPVDCIKHSKKLEENSGSPQIDSTS